MCHRDQSWCAHNCDGGAHKHKIASSPIDLDVLTSGLILSLGNSWSLHFWHGDKFCCPDSWPQLLCRLVDCSLRISDCSSLLSHRLCAPWPCHHHSWPGCCVTSCQHEIAFWLTSMPFRILHWRSSNDFCLKQLPLDVFLRHLLPTVVAMHNLWFWAEGLYGWFFVHHPRQQRIRCYCSPASLACSSIMQSQRCSQSTTHTIPLRVSDLWRVKSIIDVMRSRLRSHWLPSNFATSCQVETTKLRHCSSVSAAAALPVNIQHTTPNVNDFANPRHVPGTLDKNMWVTVWCRSESRDQSTFLNTMCRTRPTRSLCVIPDAVLESVCTVHWPEVCFRWKMIALGCSRFHATLLQLNDYSASLGTRTRVHSLSIVVCGGTVPSRCPPQRGPRLAYFDIGHPTADLAQCWDGFLVSSHASHAISAVFQVFSCG